MSLYQPSTKTASATVDEIADSAGASADTEMRTRAFRSLNAGIKYLNAGGGKGMKWAWLLTEANPIILVAPFTFAFQASAGQSSATAAAGHGLQIDDFVVGSGFSLGTRITATATTALGFNQAITGWSAGLTTAVATSNRDLYDLPSDFKAVYSVRDLGNNQWLKPANRRAFDRLVANEFNTGTPEAYDPFPFGAKGKVRILPSPGAATVVQLRYHRRMATASSSVSQTTLDIPQDYDDTLTAYSKWHMLTDKGQPDRAGTWLSVAQDGIKTMVQDQQNQPDEDLGFSVGHGGWPSNINSTRSISWDVTT